MAKTKKTKNTNETTLKMTHSSYDDLVSELENRKEVLRKDIADEISAARELGDLSENHAYTVAMEKKEMNENRILEIEDILAVVEIVNENTSNNIVEVGDSVEILNLENDEKRTVTLVGSEETKAANPLEGKISVDSPIGKAIYNAQIGETVDVSLPLKKIQYKIVGYSK
jgi:transcription elongation factor GreA